jgi:hypothetical protein
MVKLLFIVGLAGILLQPAALAAPDIAEALRTFASYEQEHSDHRANRLINRIRRELELSKAIVHAQRLPNSRVLVFVLFSRTHFPRGQESFETARGEIFRLLEAGGFQRRLYHLNDLHPDQARETIWQTAKDHVIMRMEIVPGNAITIAFFSRENFRQGLHATRGALIPPSRRRP